MNWLICLFFLLAAFEGFTQPYYQFTIGTSYSDLYIKDQIENELYRAIEDRFDHRFNLRAGISIEGTISKSLGYESGIIYKGTGATNFTSDHLEIPIVLTIKVGGMKIGSGISPSLTLRNDRDLGSQSIIPVHFKVSFKIFDKVAIAIGHLRQLNQAHIINDANFDFKRPIINEVALYSFETYLSVGYRVF